MKVNSISGMNWFFVTFIAQDREEDPKWKKKADLPEKSSGMFVYVKVDDLDDYYQGVVSNGLAPASESQKRHNGGREFMLRDPDGYQLVFFEKR